MRQERAALLETQGIVKDFPGVRALDGVSFDVRARDVHALVGENGAGKSTLMKILCGIWPFGSFEGEIRIDGKPRRFFSVRDSERAGIVIIFQELALVPELTVAQNIFLNNERTVAGVIDDYEMNQQAARLLDELDARFRPWTRVADLPVGGQQLVEIARALSRDARILILDEPTAALADAEVDTLMRIMQRLRERGRALVYISHKIEEVFRIADRVTVLRDGRTAGAYDVKDLSQERVVSLMVGREIGSIFPSRPIPRDKVILKVQDLGVDHPRLPGKRILENVSFDLKMGEVLGIAGLMGAGRTELLCTLFGLPPGPARGRIELDGKEYWPSSPGDAIGRGIAYVSEDRKRFSLVRGQSVRVNLSLASLKRFCAAGMVLEGREEDACRECVRTLGVKAPSLDVDVDALSGGNQQKVVIGRWLMTEPRVLLLDDPTRGVDVGAKHELYRLITQLAAEGKSVILVSSELPEVMNLSNRILVLAAGRPMGTFDAREISPEKVMYLATRVHAEEQPSMEAS